MTVEELEAEALKPSPTEREELVRRLLAHPGEERAPEVERAWEEEIRRRPEEYRGGAVQAVPASEVFARARDRLR